jgi:hypothetical protein
MTAIILLAAFRVVGTQVLRIGLRAPREGGDAAAMQARFDAAVGQLRRDVWGSSKFEVIDLQTVRIERPERPAVTWSVTDEGALARTLATAPPVGEESDDAARREWAGVARGVTFVAAGPVLSLVEPSGHAGEGRRVPRVSQLALANAGRAGQ